MSILLGAIADDFTGATDLANTLVKQGMRVTLVIGVPDTDIVTGNADAIVVALKSRTEPVDRAVSESLAALSWLESQGAQQYFFKYCSTFDSTPVGNIGPVADALMLALDCDFAFVCPAFPTNGRTVYQGQLFVGDQLLSESSMKDHPLTPMRDSNLPRLMSAQSANVCALIPLQQVQQGERSIKQSVAALRSQGYSYAVADAINDDDLMIIGRAAADHKLVTGGSGVALGLPSNFRSSGELDAIGSPELPLIEGGELVLAGSCSSATRAQIGSVREHWPHYKIDVDAIADGQDVTAEIIEWARAQDKNGPLLIYASSDPDEVAGIQQRHGIEASGAMVERIMGELALRLVASGFRRLLVAGGETSGAVVSALGIKALRIGPEIDPGVPWTETLGDPGVALALKSGNFGGTDFFDKAFRMLA